MGQRSSLESEDGGGEGAHTEEGKKKRKAFSQHFNRAGLAFRQAARRADGLETHCESHLGLLSSQLWH